MSIEQGDLFVAYNFEDECGIQMRETNVNEAKFILLITIQGVRPILQLKVNCVAVINWWINTFNAKLQLVPSE